MFPFSTPTLQNLSEIEVNALVTSLENFLIDPTLQSSSKKQTQKNNRIASMLISKLENHESSLNANDIRILYIAVTRFIDVLSDMPKPLSNELATYLSILPIINSKLEFHINNLFVTIGNE